MEAILSETNDDYSYIIDMDYFETLNVMTSLIQILIWSWLNSFFPIKSTDTYWALLADKPHFPIQPVVTVFFFENRRFENWFCCLFSGSLWWSWVIIRIEIKMKSCVHGWFHFYWVIRAVMHAKKENITKWKILFYSGTQTSRSLDWRTNQMYHVTVLNVDINR